MMIKIVTVEQMRKIERATDAAGVSYADMMQHAGRAVAEIVKSLLDETAAEQRVAVLVGPGNNGGDGLVTARILKEETLAEIGCYLLKSRRDDDEVFAAAHDAGVFIAVAEDDQRWRVLKNLVSNADIVVDALLGTGAQLPIKGELQKLLQTVSSALQRRQDTNGAWVWPASPRPLGGSRPVVVAVDCPSGLDCDTGDLDPLTIPANITVTFAAAKYGQLTFPGANAVGELVVAGIGTPNNLTELEVVNTELAAGQDVSLALPARPLDAHKGTFGRAMIIAGSVNYTGAAKLAGEAAYRVGAGLVTMAVPQAIYPILAAQLPEITWLLLPHDMGVINTSALDVFLEEAGDAEALLVGPGLGQDEETAGFLRGLVGGEHMTKKGIIGFVAPSKLSAAEGGEQTALPQSLVIDADGLNLLAQIEKWWELLPPGTVLTPHPGEMARLAGMERDEILTNRFNVAVEKASEWNCVVVLKGAFTAVASPSGRMVILPFATDALATAGTGDVLAGCIVGLMAQGVASFDAAVAGSYIHALAGKIAAQKASTRSVIAGDVMSAIPAAVASLDAFALR